MRRIFVTWDSFVTGAIAHGLSTAVLLTTMKVGIPAFAVTVWPERVGSILTVRSLDVPGGFAGDCHCWTE